MREAALVAPAWELRSAVPADAEFLFRVYAGTRQAELSVTGWTDEVKAAFLRSQFGAQDRHYHEAFATARFDVILAGAEPVGRLYVARSAHRIHIIDIALLPAHQNQGLGSAILRQLLAEAEASGHPVSIHVEEANRALRWYRRLGFQPLETRGLHVLMEWRPNTAPTRSASDQPNTAS